MLAPGARLGPYEIRGQLGRGAMGEVLRAWDPRLAREVAIKVLTPAPAHERDRRARFGREARAASALKHPNIVTVYDIGKSGPHHYIVMELVEGQSLRELLGNSPMPVARLLALGEQLAEGMAAAHERGIVHRDLKPENLLVGSDGRLRIVDFGLAKVLLPAAAASNGRTPSGIATAAGTVMGTFRYMSPEQVLSGPVDFRSDQFSCGVILYEMATGRCPFEREGAAQTIAALLRDVPVPPRHWNPEIPHPLQWLIEHCLAKDPAERYPSTRELATELGVLRAHLQEPRSSPPPTHSMPLEARAETAPGLLFRLVRGRRRMPLRRGDNILGRDPDCDI
jgi:serine/threonine protein kinase